MLQRRHDWTWLSEFSGVVLLCHAFSFGYFHGCIAHKTGTLVQPIVQGNALFSVEGQDTFEMAVHIVTDLTIHYQSV